MKKTPKRMCVVCRQMFDKNELLRVVKTPTGELLVDETGKANGRGAYICKNEECLANAKKRKAIERALQITSINEELFDKLRSKIVE